MTKHKAYEISHHKKLDNEQFEDNLSLAKNYDILIIRFFIILHIYIQVYYLCRNVTYD